MGKGVMFLMFMWLCTCIAGGVMAGDVQFVRTTLVTAVDDSETTITVSSTTGFPNRGIIVVENEHIAYGAKTSTTFYGTLASRLTRGVQDTDAVSHTAGVPVTTVPGSLINSSADYNIATITDSAGTMAFLTAPLALFRLLGEFFFLPLGFLGTNLAIITYFWAIIGIGMIVALAISIIGGRRI